MDIPDMRIFAQIMAGLGELYGKPVSETLTELYWVALKRFDVGAISHAVNTHINNPDAGQFMPKPADLVRYLEDSAHTKALQAWSKVNHAIRQIGQYDTLVFDDCLIHAVIHDMGGWIHLCKATEKELPFRGYEFEKRYESYLLRKPAKYPKQLMGVVDATNVARGFAAKPPLLMGDEQSALQVYLGGQDAATLMPYKPLSVDLVKQLARQKMAV